MLISVSESWYTLHETGRSVLIWRVPRTRIGENVERIRRLAASARRGVYICALIKSSQLKSVRMTCELCRSYELAMCLLIPCFAVRSTTLLTASLNFSVYLIRNKKSENPCFLLSCATLLIGYTGERRDFRKLFSRIEDGLRPSENQCSRNYWSCVNGPFGLDGV